MKPAKALALYLGLALVLVAVGLTPRSAMASQPRVQAPLIEIAAQPANAALKQFVQVTGFQLLYSSDTVQGLTTAAVSGRFPPRRALAIMLKGTGVRIIDTGENAATLLKP